MKRNFYILFVLILFSATFVFADPGESSSPSSSSQLIDPLKNYESIETPRMMGHPVDPTRDRDALYNMYSNPKVITYFRNGTPFSHEQLEKVLNFSSERQHAGKLSSRIFYTKSEDPKLVGIIGGYYDPDNQDIEIAYCLDLPFHGGGYASEMFMHYMKADVSRVQKRVIYVFADIHPNNAPSIKFIERHHFMSAVDGYFHHNNECPITRDCRCLKPTEEFCHKDLCIKYGFCIHHEHWKTPIRMPTGDYEYDETGEIKFVTIGTDPDGQPIYAKQPRKQFRIAWEDLIEYIGPVEVNWLK